MGPVEEVTGEDVVTREETRKGVLGFLRVCRTVFSEEGG